jgi:GH35 family endo-1,4-beta-xylanase
MDDMLKDMIYQTLESNSNKTKLDYINVANELFNDDGTYRNMKWNQLGWESDVSGIAGSSKINAQHPVFVGKAFQYCRDKTNAILELRDYWNEVTIEGASYNLKYKAFYQLAKHLITKGYPINAVGIQGHYDIGNINWFVQNEGLKKAVTNYKDLGLAVYITEIDLGISEWSTPKTWSSDAANQQKEDMITVLTQMIYGGATIINFWGIRDGADQGWRPDDHPLLFDEQFSAKPVYYGVQQVLNDAKVSQPTSSKPGSKEISSKEISFVGNQKILIGTQESFGGSSNLVITDIQGKTVFSQSIDNTEAEIIEPQRLSSGLYLVFIKSRSGIQSYKMVIQ